VKKRILNAVLLTVGLLVSSGSHSGDRLYRFPKGDGETAVLQLVHRINYSVMWKRGTFDGVTTQPVEGERDWQSALRQMLHGTSLDFCSPAPRYLSISKNPKIPYEHRQDVVTVCMIHEGVKFCTGRDPPPCRDES
jgi:hypothetical protein